MNPAQHSRIEREKYPERYCPKCLWSVARSGPCPRHMLPPPLRCAESGCIAMVGGKTRYAWEAQYFCRKHFQDRVDAALLSDHRAIRARARAE